MGSNEGMILLMQQASFWFGMGITVWGIVEAKLDIKGRS